MQCALIRVCHVALLCFSEYTILVTRMAHGSIHEFDPRKESVADFHEHFEFHCVANNIQSGEGTENW